MQLRRHRSHRLSLLAAGLVLATPVLGGCGFNYATDRVNVISAGVNDRSGTVDVLGAVVIAGQDDLGLFVATFVNKDAGDEITLTGVEPNDTLQAQGEVEPLEIPARGRADLFKTGGIAVSGSFKAGDFVPVTLTFSDGQVSTLDVNVVTPCHQYSLDKLTDLTLPTAPAAPGASASDDAAADDVDAESDVDARYSCEPLAPIDPHAEGGEGEGGAEGGAEGGEGASE